MNIILIGYRGTGKSSLGKRLAATLQRPFADSDDLIIQRAHQTIKQIFETQGEQAFRDLESQVIADLAKKDNQVLSLGGGAVLRPQNIALLKPNAKIIWLQADPQTLLARITADSATAASRPNLTAAGGLEEIKSLLATRTPLYRAAATLTLNVSHLTPDQAVQSLLQKLQQQSI